jgi:hypothetical protein
MTRTTLETIYEALVARRATWEGWLRFRNTTAEERQLGNAELRLIKSALEELAKENV